MDENRIHEKIFINIGNTRQGMFIVGENINNPVLLFLHGGPGMPTFFLEKQYPTGLAQHFTVCYWEQTGGGFSFSPEISPEEMSVERIVNDAIEVTKYLRQRFGKEKIYLMGHSWGSLIGILTSARAPHLFEAYIGVAQITNQSESEKLAFKYMLDKYTEAGNRGMVSKFGSYNLENGKTEIIRFFKSPLRDKTMHELGIGTMHGMKSVISGVFIPFMTSKHYSITERINLWRAKMLLLNKTKLIEELFSHNFPDEIPKLAIPVYFLSGIHDLTVNYELSREYLKKIDAPVKGFYTFEKSAHSPMHEEPARFIDIMREDVKMKSNKLADAF
ncbi:MAG: alpha/beta hydrolase [Ignavibacteria bacterium]|nr:alpha/beta hydrolase [Ignavibacteria bacterium]